MCVHACHYSILWGFKMFHWVNFRYNVAYYTVGTILLQAAYLYWEKLHENLLWIGERWNSGACKYRFQYLIPVYQLLVYPTIGQFARDSIFQHLHESFGFAHAESNKHVDRAVKTFSSSRLIMNSRWLWNLHQRHKFLRAEASRDILSLLSLRNGIFRGFQEVFSTTDAILFSSEYSQHWEKGHGETFTDLNLFKYAFNVIQNWNTDTLQYYFIWWCLFFVSSDGRRRWKKPAKDGHL